MAASPVGRRLPGLNMDNPLPAPAPVALRCGVCDFVQLAVPTPAPTGPASRVWLVHAPSCPECGDPDFGR
ncbi:hypothetical protein [Brevundimonas sp.]|uniref:hypothetical protein n=1 Tax=Brevundimonas sp. TaxID=1871086 RepID=UPI002D43B8A4|nr:hypothetical protein [Brevundimonas sp.]HYD26940.1 hypothetical protein [Brevundimonas sp.]